MGSALTLFDRNIIGKLFLLWKNFRIISKAMLRVDKVVIKRLATNAFRKVVKNYFAFYK